MNEENTNNLYFKDCFTKTDNEQINAEFHKVSAECFISKNNKFSLDENGNLTVNSITSKTLVNLDISRIYPIGSIYLSVNPTNPREFFGGVWVSIAQGRTLVGVDTSQEEFRGVQQIGGEKTHVLSLSEMPSHNHAINSQGNDQYTGRGWVVRGIDGYDSNQAMDCIRVAGGSQAHNNLQPYYTCYIWERIA